FLIMAFSIYSREIKQDIIDGLIARIKSRKGLENLDNKLCVQKIGEFLKQDSRCLKRLSSAMDFRSISKSKEVKAVLKYVKAELRPIYGLFVEKDLRQINKILERGHLHKGDIDQILSMHVSSKERLSFYPEFYNKIFEITGKPTSIVDVASGLNPFAFRYMGLSKNIKYIAVELNQNDASIINKFFEIEGINGKALKSDITKEPMLFRADVAFAFKIFDLIDSKIVERIIKELDVKWIIASFSTKTISRRDMRFKRRSGFQKMLRRLGFKYTTIVFPNELVYCIKKIA
ncbi:MAG: hypothetical protein N3D84_03765, partial [Candidatus Woesearchaeota archaeon]|nr:hypothetical protein [Candidatus Woesearchaeota archaeon]